ncbi:MAG: hypothetical protein ACPG51_15695 [Thiolinea sp.]
METIKNTPPSGSDIAKTIAAQTESAHAEEMLTGQAAEVMQGADEEKGLDLVRSILFGQQARETEKKQASLERQIQESVDTLNREIQQQIKMLQGELGALTEAFEEEAGKQQKEANTVAEHFVRVEKSIATAAEVSQKKHQELEQHLRQEAGRIEQKARDWREEILQKLEQTGKQLQHDKADRKSVAALLQSMAQQLAAEADTPENAH